MLTLALGISALVGIAQAGTKIWDGTFNNYPTVATFDNCAPKHNNSLAVADVSFRVVG